VSCGCTRQLTRSRVFCLGRPSGQSALAGGLGYLLAQQLVSVGETVLDLQPKLGSGVRLLATGNDNKHDPNDARSVAIAALRCEGLRPGGRRRPCRAARQDDRRVAAGRRLLTLVYYGLRDGKIRCLEREAARASAGTART
jgi:hypothetical protein